MLSQFCVAFRVAFCIFHRIKVFIYLIIKVILFVRESVPIYPLHRVITCPSASFHDVLIWHSECVHDRCTVVPQIMEAELWRLGVSDCPDEPVRDLIRCSFNDLPVYSLQFLNYKMRKMYCAIPCIGLWLLHDPVPGRILDEAFTYGYDVSLNVIAGQCTDLSTSHGTESSKQDR